MEKVITFCLVIVGLINVAPVIGILSAQHLEAAYDVSLKGNDLAILMRHRALLFGILGAFVLYSAFNPSLQPAAMIMVGASMLGFVWSLFGVCVEIVWSMIGVCSYFVWSLYRDIL